MGNAVLITGSNRGLGLSLTSEFLLQDFTVYTISRSISDALLDLQRNHPESLECFEADVSDLSSLGAVARQFSVQGKTVDILINNAAVHLEKPPPDLEDLDFDRIIRTLEVNAVSPLKVIQHFLPFTKKMIVNISSEAGSIENCWRDREYGYCMSKAALNMASKILQNRLGADGIKILAIHPQWFSSEMGGPSAPISPAEAAAFVRQTILKTWTSNDPIYVDSKTSQRMPW